METHTYCSYCSMCVYVKNNGIEKHHALSGGLCSGEGLNGLFRTEKERIYFNALVNIAKLGGDCFDCDLDGESNSYYSTNIVGHGKNKVNAIQDWNEKMEMRNNENA